MSSGKLWGLYKGAATHGCKSVPPKCRQGLSAYPCIYRVPQQTPLPPLPGQSAQSQTLQVPVATLGGLPLGQFVDLRSH